MDRIEIRENRKQQIAEVALELFSRDTFQGVSVSQIAKACGVSKGLMYNYFESKEALLRFILKEYSSKIYAELDLNNDGTLSKEEFVHFMRTIYRMVCENRKYYKLIFALSFQENVAELLYDIADTMVPFSYELFKNYFESLGKSDPDAELLLFSSMLKGIIIQVVMLPEIGEAGVQYQKSFDDLVERVIEDYI